MYILLAVAALILILLLVPIKAVAEKKDGFDFYLKILWFKIEIKDRPRKKKKKVGKSKQQEKKKKKFSFAVVKKVAGLSDDIKDFAHFFSKRCIVVDNIRLNLAFGTGDAAQTGIATGILNTVAYGTLAVIHQNVRLKKWSVEITPDFQEEKFEFEFLCIGTTHLLHIIGIGIKGLKLYKKFRAE